MKHFVSVIIPTYNRLALLKEAVESVQSQTCRNYEIIVIDDGSTDATPGFLDSAGYLSYTLQHSGKPGYVRNYGFQKSNGDYIAFLDSDDLWKPDKLEQQLAFFSDFPYLQICHTREIWLRNGKIISQKGQTHRKHGYIFEDALQKCIIGPSTVMMKRELFLHAGMFHPGLEIAEDYELWLSITAAAHVGYIDKPLVIKRAGHPGQLSEKYGHIEYFRIQALDSLLKKNILDPIQRRQAVMEIIRKCRIYAAGCRKRGKTDEAEQIISLAERYADTIQ